MSFLVERCFISVWCATGRVRSQESEGSEESEGMGRGDLHTGRRPCRLWLWDGNHEN